MKMQCRVQRGAAISGKQWLFAGGVDEPRRAVIDCAPVAGSRGAAACIESAKPFQPISLR